MGYSSNQGYSNYNQNQGYNSYNQSQNNQYLSNQNQNMYSSRQPISGNQMNSSQYSQSYGVTMNQDYGNLQKPTGISTIEGSRLAPSTQSYYETSRVQPATTYVETSRVLQPTSLINRPQ